MKNKILFLFFIFMILFSFTFVLAKDYGGKISTSEYEISRSKVERTIQEGTIFRDSIEIFNKGESNLNFIFSAGSNLNTILDFENNSLLLSPGELSSVSFILKGEEIGNYVGEIQITGSFEEKILVNITINDKEQNPPFLIGLERVSDKNFLNKPLHFKLNINKLYLDSIYGVNFTYFILDSSSNSSYSLGKESFNISNSFQKILEFSSPEEIGPGNYIFEVLAFQEGFSTSDKIPVSLILPFHKRTFFGIPFWAILLFMFILGVSFGIYFFIKKRIESKRRYKMKIDFGTLPRKNKDYFFLGRVAEKSFPIFFDPGRLTTHTIVAGATGGGKSISAQVIIEEALKKNISVVVFDPTAQWSGMLRKCTDKKMMAYYPKFGLKESDAQAFKGNVRQVQNARELINLNKHLAPGQIQIFSLDKLDTKDMDIFVANIIREIFHSNPKEYPTLKTLVVFDEVHRLLPKFGGTGQGFLQIERACREFRKWGIGVMLVSQVLSDFVGEIKANISTEIQMRTRDEGDLGRINTKYGESFLQSLVKASVGVGMVVNPKYNHAQPFFVNFRPILHSTRRLPDEELEKYNKYNGFIDEFEFQVEQLEKEKVDVFDLKLELKLIKDKLMSGSFQVVEIYIEGLKPRLEKAFEKLGKKPKKREIKLVDEKEILASIAEAKKQREEVEAKEAKAEGAKEKVVVAKNIQEKQVAPLIFDNGIMVGSLKELVDYLPSMDSEIFSVHVNEEKNDVLTWFKTNFPEENASALSKVSSKEEIVNILSAIGNKEEKKEAPKENKNEVKK